MPLYEEGEFVGVCQLCRDETKRQRKQEAVRTLQSEVERLTATANATTEC